MKKAKEAMEYEAQPIKNKVSARVVRSEIFREMDNLSLGWHVWYNLRRHKFQIVVLIVLTQNGIPLVRFAHQFFV